MSTLNPIPITADDIGRHAIITTNLGFPAVVRVVNTRLGVYAWGMWAGRPCTGMTGVARWFNPEDVCTIDEDRCLVLRDGRVVELTGDEARVAVAAQGEG